MASPAKGRRRRQARLVAWMTGSLAALVLGVGCIACWQGILEWWYLPALESSDEGARIGAASALANLRSPRAVMALVDALQEAEAARLAGPSFSKLSAWGCKLQEAIAAIGKPAAPALLKAWAGTEGGLRGGYRTYGLPLVHIDRDKLEDRWEAAVRGSCIGEPNRVVLSLVLLQELVEDDSEPEDIRSLAATVWNLGTAPEE